MNLFELAVVISATDKATQVLGKVRTALGGVGKAAEGLKSIGQAASVQGALMQGAGKQMTDALTSVVAPTLAIEEALAHLKIVAPDAIGAARQAAEQFAGGNAQSASEYVATVTSMMRAGLDLDAALAGASTSLQLATATQGEGAATAKLLLSTYATLGDEALGAAAGMAKVADVLTRARGAFGIESMDQFREALVDGGTVAAQHNVSLEQTVSVLGEFAKVGIVGGKAGGMLAQILPTLTQASTQLGFGLKRTADGGLDLVGTLAELAGKYGDLGSASPELRAQLEEAFGSGLQPLSILLSRSADLERGLGKVTDAYGVQAGAAAEAARVLNATPTAQLAILNNHLDAAKDALGRHILPVVNELAPKVMKVITAFGKFAEANPGLMRTAATVAVVAAAVLSVVGPLLLISGSMLLFAGHTLAAGTAVVKFVPKLIGAVTWMGAYAVALARAALNGLRMAAGAVFNPAMWARVGAGISTAASALVRYAMTAAAAAARGIALAATTVMNPFTWLRAGTAIGTAAGALVRYATTAVVAAVRGIALAATTVLNPATWIRAAAGLGSMIVAMWRYVASTTVAAARSVALAASAAFNPAMWMRGATAVGTMAVSLGRLGVTMAVNVARSAATAVVSLGQFVALMATGAARAFMMSAGPLMNPATWMPLIVSLKAAAVGAWNFAAALLANPITWIVLAIAAAAALIYVYWDPIKAFFVELWTTVSDSFTAGWSIITQAWENFSLYDAGAKILSTLVEGIKAMASAPVDAMRAVVTKVRALLPFSPAKEGPLRDLHRVRLVETIADAVSPDSLVNRMRQVAVAVAAVPMVLSPDIAPPVPSRAELAGTSGGAPTMQVSIVIEGNADASTVQQLERWVQERGAMLYDAIEREGRNRNRVKF